MAAAELMGVLRAGGCACGAVRYAMRGAPMIVHCCHCTDCQRETGSGFVINAVIEADRVTVTGGTAPVLVTTPSASGKGQEIARCPECHVALWSHYPWMRRLAAFVRVGTLDDAAALVPNVHIFVRSKLPWVRLPEGVRMFAAFYDNPAAVWGAEAWARRGAL